MAGYLMPEKQSGLSKIALQWMIEEAKSHGLLLNTAMVNHLVKGHKRWISRNQTAHCFDSYVVKGPVNGNAHVGFPPPAPTQSLSH
jgi:hypothetical protein